MKKEQLQKIISGIIAALFFYAAISKLVDFNLSRHEMLNQVFPNQVAEVLVWLIPAIEIALMILLLFPQSRRKALLASFFLLLAFTFYIGIVITGIFGRKPCSCGGILKDMPYSVHLIFNLFFVALAFCGIAIENRWIVYNRWFNLKDRKELAQNSG